MQHLTLMTSIHSLNIQIRIFKTLIQQAFSSFVKSVPLVKKTQSFKKFLSSLKIHFRILELFHKMMIGKRQYDRIGMLSRLK